MKPPGGFQTEANKQCPAAILPGTVRRLRASRSEELRERVDEVEPVWRANAGHVIPANAGSERRVCAKGDDKPARREWAVVHRTEVGRDAIQRLREVVRREVCRAVRIGDRAG